jgi:uncharacterized protein
MWIIELALEPTPERIAARPAHRQLLTELHGRGALRMAGPFPDDSGAVLVFDVPDRAALDEIVAGDAYYRTPGVTVRRVQEWSPILT